MKTFFYLLTVLLTANLSIAIAQPTRVNIDGTWYTNGETAYIECGKSSVYVYIDEIIDGPPDYDYLYIRVNPSSNFSASTTSNPVQDVLTLDSNHQDGYIDVGFAGYTGDIRVSVRQKPPTPTFTGTASLCSTSSSGTFSVSDSYGFSGTKPLNLVWQTTGGVTVNGGSTYTTSSATTSSVTIQSG